MNYLRMHSCSALVTPVWKLGGVPPKPLRAECMHAFRKAVIMFIMV